MLQSRNPVQELGFGIQCLIECHYLTESTLDPTGGRGAWDIKLREEVHITGGDDLGLDSMVVATSFAVSHRDWTPTLQVSFGNSRALVPRFRSISVPQRDSGSRKVDSLPSFSIDWLTASSKSVFVAFRARHEDSESLFNQDRRIRPALREST